MDKLVLIPFIIASVLLLNNSTQKVFVWVYIPMLTMVPNYFDSKIVQGLPELHFWSAALIPVVIVWVFRGFENYQYQWMDFMILSYVLVVFYTQWLNSDYKIAQKILFNTALTNLVPYILVRSLFRSKEEITELVKSITVIGAIIAAFNCYEARMFLNIFDEYLRRIWPHSVTWDVGFILSRAGFKRAMGPFSHPIISGFFFTISLPMALWNHYEKHFKDPKMGKAVVIFNALGLLASIAVTLLVKANEKTIATLRVITSSLRLVKRDFKVVSPAVGPSVVYRTNRTFKRATKWLAVRRGLAVRVGLLQKVATKQMGILWHARREAPRLPTPALQFLPRTMAIACELRLVVNNLGAS
jgi:hypothetical protein